MSRRTTTTRRSPGRVLSSHAFVNTRKGAAFLEGPADRAAASIVADGGVLRIFEDYGPYEHVSRLQGTPGADASTLVSDALGAVGLVDAKNRETVMEAVFEALRVDLCTAYLVGVAVGRRLGPQSFKSGRR